MTCDMMVFRAQIVFPSSKQRLSLRCKILIICLTLGLCSYFIFIIIHWILENCCLWSLVVEWSTCIRYDMFSASSCDITINFNRTFFLEQDDAKEPELCFRLCADQFLCRILKKCTKSEGLHSPCSKNVFILQQI